MQAGDKVFNFNSCFIVTKIKKTTFKARLNSAYFDGNTFDYHFSETLDGWVINSEPIRATKLRKN